MINVPELRNTYFSLRHGMSTANKKGIVASGWRGILGYGLTPEGQQQVRDSVTTAKDEGLLDSNIVFMTSPMKRARQSARIAAEVLGIPRRDIHIRWGLRERFFAKYEGKSQKNYRRTVWPVDPIFQDKRPDGTESVNHVRNRMVGEVTHAEKRYTNKKVVFTGHGDPLQILEATFAGIPAGDHRSIENMGNAALRNLNESPQRLEGKRKGDVTMIGISGGAGSGKSTLAKGLAERLGSRATVISYDDYYISRSKRVAQDIDEEGPCAFDNEAFIQNLLLLSQGQSAEQSGISPKTLLPSPIVIVEGYLILIDRRVRNLLDKSYYLDVTEDEMMRRRKQRRDPAHPNRHETDKYLEKVMLPGFHNFVLPQRKYADVILDATHSRESLVQEISAGLG